MSVLELKRMAGERAADFVRSGMVVGLGTGSTAIHAVNKIGRLLREGVLRDIVGIPTSTKTEQVAREWGIPLTTLQEHPVIDLTIDGADEVDPQLNMIKGGGGALLREKIVAHVSRREIIVIDPSKLVQTLGSTFPLPVEVIPFGWNICAEELRQLGFEPRLRMAGELPYVTDEGNYILDCRVPKNPDVVTLERALNAIPGVVENGFFVGHADLVIVGRPEGVQFISAERKQIVEGL